METESRTNSEPTNSINENKKDIINPPIDQKIKEKEEKEEEEVPNTKLIKEETNLKNENPKSIKSKMKDKSKKKINDSRENNHLEQNSEIIMEQVLQENQDIIIEINDEKDLPQIKEEKNIFKIPVKKNKKKPKKRKSELINKNTPFTFFKNEKIKDVNFKEAKLSEYIKELSLQWKKMSYIEKEPYIKLALDLKNNLSKSQKLINKKRKRVKFHKNKNIINEEKKKELNKDIRKKNKSVSRKSKIENNKIRNKSELRQKKMFVINNGENGDEDGVECVKEYFNSIFAPFIENSYNFIKNKGIINS